MFGFEETVIDICQKVQYLYLDWREKMNCALIVIDMQYWFFRTEERRGKLNQLISSINELIEFADSKKIPVIHVKTEHKADKSTWNIVMKKHDLALMIENSEEAKMLKEIIVRDNHKFIVKTRQSTFIRTNFEEILRQMNIDTLILAGVFTHGCVGRTAIDAYERDYNVIIAKDCVFSHVKNQEQAMLEVIQFEQEQMILDNQEIERFIYKGEIAQ